MFLLSVFFPLLGGLINTSPVARYLGHRGSSIVAILCMLVSFLASVVIYYEVVFMGCAVSIDVFGTWFTVGTFGAGWTFNFDLLTANMLFTVTGVSMAVHMYACDYMRQDPHLNLFLGYLSFFTGFMCVLVAADNLLVMLVGWEGIGVCSYLLIGYWSHRLSAVKSAQKAILVNRISDGLLMWGILWVWYHLGSLEYDLLNVYSASSFVGLSFLIGAMGKSAQILFHVWLADAMEGPTPVSALIHAATLVTAGVYLLVRLHIHDETFVIIVGCLTAFMAGVFGATQSDLKRVIAYSTCSQLGWTITTAINLTIVLLIYMDLSNLLCVYYSFNLCLISTPSQTTTDIKPPLYVDFYDNLCPLKVFEIKQKYKQTPVIYLWHNKINQRCYVGHTNNFAKRLENYNSRSYLMRTKRLMPICAALYNYTQGVFALYIIEVFSTYNKSVLLTRENYWVNNLKPSYNVAPILDRFVGLNHPRSGKTVNQEVRNKISSTLKGRTLTPEHKANIGSAQKRKPIYCYHYNNGIFVTSFISIRDMCRQLSLKSTVQVLRKVNNAKPFCTSFNGTKQTWRIYTNPQH